MSYKVSGKPKPAVPGSADRFDLITGVSKDCAEKAAIQVVSQGWWDILVEKMADDDDDAP